MDGQRRKRRKKGRTHLSTPRKQGRRGRNPMAGDADNLEEQAVEETKNAECSGEPEIESVANGASSEKDDTSMGGAKPQVSSGGGQSESPRKIAPSNQENTQKEQGSDQQQPQQEQENQLGESVQKLSLPPLPSAPRTEAPIAGLPGQQSHQRLKPLRPLEPAAPGMSGPQWPAHTFWMHAPPPCAPLQRPSDGHLQPRVQILQPNPSLPPVIIYPPPFMPSPPLGPVHLRPGLSAPPVSFNIDPQTLASWPPPKQQTVAAAHPELVKMLTCSCNRSGSERGTTQSAMGDATQPAKKCTCDVYKFCRQVGALPLSEDVAAALAAFQHDDTSRGRKEEAVRYFLSQVMRQVLGFNVPFLHKLCALAEAANARSQCEPTKGAGLSTRTESLCNLVTTCLPLKPATSAERALGTVLLPLECVAASPFIFKLYKELNMSKGGQKRAPS